MRSIYFDYNATTPLDPEVLQKMIPVMRDTFGNPSSVHHVGRQARALLDEARYRVAHVWKCRPGDIIFTGGGTESNNLAVFGAVISYVLQMLSFLLLRRRLPDIERPYRSPLGVAGAWMALVIAAVTLVALFVVDPIYQKVALAAAVWYAAGLLWFALIGRRNLVYSPEEAFALRARRG